MPGWEKALSWHVVGTSHLNTPPLHLPGQVWDGERGDFGNLLAFFCREQTGREGEGRVISCRRVLLPATAAEINGKQQKSGLREPTPNQASSLLPSDLSICQSSRGF